MVDDIFNESSVNIKRSLSINTKAKNKFHDEDDNDKDDGVDDNHNDNRLMSCQCQLCAGYIHTADNMWVIDIYILTICGL